MWNLIDDLPREIKKYEDILNESGYPWEKYEVTTEDGYINSMYRINFSRNTEYNNNHRRPPVILLHGMNCCSGVFLNQSRLAYYLVDEGFDVWLPNCRGTTLSRKHIEFDYERDKEKYWNYSWHEIGVYDLPAFVDFVVEKTGFQKIHYIGYSQGTTVFAVCATERPEYNEKIALSCLFGCVIACEFDKSFRLLFMMYIFVPLLQFIDRFLFCIHQGPFSNTIRLLLKHTSNGIIGRYINLLCMFMLTGYADFEQASQLDLQGFIRTEPNTYSVRQLYHYVQQMKSRRFAKYDYGAKINKMKYGTPEPPEYNLEKITSPVALFYGKNDLYNDFRKDKLDRRMPNVVDVHVVKYELFNHLDFATAKDSVSLLYRNVVKIMRKYEPK